MQIDQKVFMEIVLGLEEEARKAGSVIGADRVREAFADTGWTGDELDEIFRYFEARQIRIEGRDKPVDEDPSDSKFHTKETKRDRDMVEMYMQEMESAFHFEQGQEAELIARLCDGDEEARDLLVEGYLPMAVEIAGAYRGRGLLHADLIQECNLGLLLAVSEYGEDSLVFEGEDREMTDSGRFRDYLEEAICAHVEEQLMEYTQSMKSARKMVRQMNRLNDTAMAYARDHDKEASPEELAERMGLAVDEVRRLMKSSLDAIHVLETGRFDS